MAALRVFGSGLAIARARYALESAGLEADVPLTRADSVTNEVWLTPGYVIRVNRRPDKRLWREAQLVGHLPPTVRSPRIVDYGSGQGFDWLVSHRRPGEVLSKCWLSMRFEERRRAVQQFAAQLRILHATPCPLELPVADAPQLLRRGGQEPPVEPLLSALDRVRGMKFVEPQLVAEIRERVEATASALGLFNDETFIHGDLTFENVLWDGTDISLIDFEWARPAPSDLDLDVLLRFCAYPFLHVPPEYEGRSTAEEYEDVPWWLAEDYPELFSRPQQIERVLLYSIAYDVRDLLAFPPPAPPRELSSHHPLHRLRRTIAGRSHIDVLSRPRAPA